MHFSDCLVPVLDVMTRHSSMDCLGLLIGKGLLCSTLKEDRMAIAWFVDEQGVYHFVLTWLTTQLAEGGLH